MPRIVLPPGPITAPILSTGIVMVVIRGAYGLISSRGAAMASAIFARILSLAAFACTSVSLMISSPMLWTLMSSWMAVMPSAVPATLKSMSPKWSSMPWMSVRVTKLPLSSVISPTEIPATGFLRGTPASIRARVVAHVLAIDVLPFELRHSATTRIVYGNSSSLGSMAVTARSASAPWPISRLPVNILPVSPVLNGGKL